MDTQFKNTDETVAEVLDKTIASLKDEHVRLSQLLEYIGEQGLLVFCAFLTLPFLIPVSIPGISTIFGLVIILIGIGVTLSRIPWLPERLMQKTIPRDQLVPALEKGKSFFQRFERWSHPRLERLTHGKVVNFANGLGLTFAAVLLIMPFGFVPFSNTLPAIAILLFTLGILQRDGLFILGGYLVTVLSVVYFVGLIVAAILAGQAIILG